MQRLVIASLVVLASCGSSNSGASDAAIDGAIATTPETCAQVSAGLTGFETGVDSTPGGFTSAPPGTTLCGTEPGTKDVGYYLAGSETSTAFFTYYRSQLQSLGYDTTGPTANGTDSSVLMFTDGDTGASGTVVFNAKDLYFAITYPTNT